MSRGSELYLQDIDEACAQIVSWTHGMDLAAFRADERTVAAVERNLLRIGEAAKKLPPHVTVRAPEIEWRKIAGPRDVLAHAYFAVDVEIVWSVVESKIPTLAEAVRRLRSD